MRKTEIKDKKYRRLVFSGKVFNNYTFTDCNFINCTFKECTFVDCKFENCELEGINTSQFISCSFSSCCILGLTGSYLLDCQFSDVCFDHNRVVTGNTFDRVRGNIKFNRCLGVYNNTFKDMDFSGFIDSYYLEIASCFDLVQNSFINTNISIDAIKRLIKRLAGKTNYCFGYGGTGRGNRSPESGMIICLKMCNLSDEEKFGLIANALLRLPKVEEKEPFFDSERGLFKGHFHLFFDDNPMPLKIVDENGRVLRPDAIPRLDMQIDICKEAADLYNSMIMVDIERGKYGVDTDDDSIYESSRISL